MKRWNIKYVIRIISICAFVGCVLYIGAFYFQGFLNQKKYASLAQMIDQKEYEKEKVLKRKDDGNPDHDKDDYNIVADNIVGNNEDHVNTPEILPEFTELYEKNNQMIGWLTIPDTIINYPVMQGEDNDYYLNHDFYGEISKHGSLFLDYQCDVLLPNTNLIIYGHNMKDGTMFSGLRKYKDKSYYEEHKTIAFDTIYEKGQYEIVAVFLSKVYLKNQDVFKYYQFIQASTEEEFYYFYDNIKKLSLYETGVKAEYGDSFLTLSTCDYTTEDGRLVVVGKKIQNH